MIDDGSTSWETGIEGLCPAYLAVALDVVDDGRKRAAENGRPVLLKW